MNHILHNISLILLLGGIIILTISLTKSYGLTQNPNQCVIKEKVDKKETDEKPSKIFADIFKQASPWMGYTEFK